MKANELKVGDKVEVKGFYGRKEVIGIHEGEVRIKPEFGLLIDSEWVAEEAVLKVLPKFVFDGRANIGFYVGERAMSNLRHAFAKEFHEPVWCNLWEVWGKKGILAIENGGKDGLFNFFRDFAKFVIENIGKEEELEAIKAHNLLNVKGYSEAEFNKDLKDVIIENVKNSFAWDGCQSYEVFGKMKRAYGDWDEFFEILEDGFVKFINKNF